MRARGEEEMHFQPFASSFFIYIIKLFSVFYQYCFNLALPLLPLSLSLLLPSFYRTHTRFVMSCTNKKGLLFSCTGTTIFILSTLVVLFSFM